MLEKVAHPVRIRSLPAERSLRSSGCLQTLITSANGGPFLNRDDANIYRRVPTPYSWTPASSHSTPTSTIPPRSFWTSFPRRLSRQIYSSSTVENPMETYLSGCPDDAKSNFVSRGWAATWAACQKCASWTMKMRLHGHDWISGGRHCTRRIESTWVKVCSPPNRGR